MMHNGYAPPNGLVASWPQHANTIMAGSQKMSNPLSSDPNRFNGLFGGHMAVVAVTALQNNVRRPVMPNSVMPPPSSVMMPLSQGIHHRPPRFNAPFGRKQELQLKQREAAAQRRQEQQKQEQLAHNEKIFSAGLFDCPQRVISEESRDVSMVLGRYKDAQRIIETDCIGIDYQPPTPMVVALADEGDDNPGNSGGIPSVNDRISSSVSKNHSLQSARIMHQRYQLPPSTKEAPKPATCQPPFISDRSYPYGAKHNSGANRLRNTAKILPPVAINEVNNVCLGTGAGSSLGALGGDVKDEFRHPSSSFVPSFDDVKLQEMFREISQPPISAIMTPKVSDRGVGNERFAHGHFVLPPPTNINSLDLSSQAYVRRNETSASVEHKSSAEPSTLSQSVQRNTTLSRTPKSFNCSMAATSEIHSSLPVITSSTTSSICSAEKSSNCTRVSDKKDAGDKKHKEIKKDIGDAFKRDEMYVASKLEHQRSDSPSSFDSESSDDDEESSSEDSSSEPENSTEQFCLANILEKVSSIHSPGPSGSSHASPKLPSRKIDPAETYRVDEDVTAVPYVNNARSSVDDKRRRRLSSSSDCSPAQSPPHLEAVKIKRSSKLSEKADSIIVPPKKSSKKKKKSDDADKDFKSVSISSIINDSVESPDPDNVDRRLKNKSKRKKISMNLELDNGSGIVSKTKSQRKHGKTMRIKQEVKQDEEMICDPSNDSVQPKVNFTSSSINMRQFESRVHEIQNFVPPSKISKSCNGSSFSNVKARMNVSLSSESSPSSNSSSDEEQHSKDSSKVAMSPAADNNKNKAMWNIFMPKPSSYSNGSGKGKGGKGKGKGGIKVEVVEKTNSHTVSSPMRQTTFLSKEHVHKDVKPVEVKLDQGDSRDVSFGITRPRIECSLPMSCLSRRLSAFLMDKYCINSNEQIVTELVNDLTTANRSGRVNRRPSCGNSGPDQPADLMPPPKMYYSYLEHRRDEDEEDEPGDNDDDYQQNLNNARILKQDADREQDREQQAVKYLQAVLSFCLCGYVNETIDKSAAFTMYKETLNFIKNVSKPFGTADVGKFDKNCRLAVLSLRCQSLLYLKLYKMRRLELRECQKIIGDHIEKAASRRPNTPTGVSPSHLAPSPADSEGSFCSSGYTSAGEGRGHIGGVITPPTAPQISQICMSVPQSVMQKQHQYCDYLTQCHELWEQADMYTLRGHCKDFIISLDRISGPLTLHSSLKDLVRYTRAGLDCLVTESGASRRSSSFQRKSSK